MSGTRPLPVIVFLLAFSSSANGVTLSLKFVDANGTPLKSVASGKNVTGIVGVGGAAAMHVLSVSLTSNSASVPAVVDVSTDSLGAGSATFPIATQPLGSAQTVTVRAALGTTLASASLSLEPVPASLSLSPATILGGSQISGSIAVRDAQPLAVTFPLSSSNPSLASTPPAVTIPQGQRFASFTVPTQRVAAPTNVSISTSTGTALLTLVPLSIQAVELSAPAMEGAGWVDGIVRLNGTADSQKRIPVTSDSALAPALYPSAYGVIIEPGQSSGAFRVSTQPVAADTVVTYSAVDGTITKTATLTLRAPRLAALDTVYSSRLGGQKLPISVTLTSTPIESVDVPITSSRPDLISVPGTLHVPAGSRGSGQIEIPVASADADTQVVLTAGSGAEAKASTVTVTAYHVKDFTLTSTSVSPIEVGGMVHALSTAPQSQLYGRVVLNTAPLVNVTVPLASTDSAHAAVGETVTVAAGQPWASVAIATTPVQSDTPVTLTAGRPGDSKTATLILVPVKVRSVALTSAVVKGGMYAAGQISLNGPVPPGEDFTFALTSSDTSVATFVESPVTVPQNAASVAFKVRTKNVIAPRTVTITATRQGENWTSDLTLQPIGLTAFHVSSERVIGGESPTMTAQIDALGTDGFAVRFSSSDPGLVPVPAFTTFPSDSAIKAVAIETGAATGDHAVTLTASTSANTLTTTLIVGPPPISALNIGSTLAAGSTANAIVTLSRWTATGQTVPLSVDNPAALTVPSAVVIPVNGTSATFPVTVNSVASDTPVVITAGKESWAKAVTVTVRPQS